MSVCNGSFQEPYSVPTHPTEQTLGVNTISSSRADFHNMMQRRKRRRRGRRRRSKRRVAATNDHQNQKE